MAITAPLGITIYLSFIFINFVDNNVKNLVPDKYNPKNFTVYLNTRNRTHSKRFHELYEYINDLIREVNKLSRDQSNYELYRHQHETLIIKLLKCIDHNSWFLSKYSWGRTTQNEAMRKGFISVLKDFK